MVSYCDAAKAWQLGFQDPAAPIAEGIMRFHHDLMVILVSVVVFVGYMLGRCIQLYNKENNGIPSRTVHGTELEIVWTLVPARLLVTIAIPSFALLYSVDEVSNPALTVKVVGHQWYWTYERSDYMEDGERISFESYMLPEDELEVGNLRLLEVDNRLALPIDTNVRLIITAADVLHSWAVPSLGVKLDGCPGRLNQASVRIKREGVYYGQCSEICGINHGFMPIAVEGLELEDYYSWRLSHVS